MSLSSVLQTTFHSYLQTATDIQICMTVISMWKKPSYYRITAYYCKTTNQIIWEGYTAPHKSLSYVEFKIFERGDRITVEYLLMNLLEILGDKTDLVMDKDCEGCLDRLVIDMIDEEVIINN